MTDDILDRYRYRMDKVDREMTDGWTNRRENGGTDGLWAVSEG